MMMMMKRSSADGTGSFPSSLFLIIFVLCCIFVTCIPSAQAQTIDVSRLWNPGARCVNTTEYIAQNKVYSACVPYIQGQASIYIDNYQNFRDGTVIALSQTVSSVNNCTARSVQIVCAMAYRECYEIDVPQLNATVAMGTLPCRPFCEIWRSDCIILYMQRGSSLLEAETILNCTSLNPGWGFGFNTFFPNGTYTHPVQVQVGNITTTVNATMPCSDRTASIFAGYGLLLCPEGTHNEGPDSCALNCPEPLISDSEYDQAELMLSIVGWFSFIGTAFVVVSFMLSPMDKLAYPSVLSFFFTVCIMCLSFTFCLGSMVGHQEIWCENNETPHRWGDGWCTIQGITYVFFTLAGGLWWLSIAINLVATVIFRYTPATMELFRVGRIKFTHAYMIIGLCHLICWGIPLVVIIITLSSHHLGFGGSDFWCSIHSDENITFVVGDSGLTTEGSSDAQAIDIWNLILLTIPMFIITIVGAVLFLAVIIVAMIKSQEGWKFFLRQWRLLGLLMLYIWIYSFVFSAHLQFSTQRKQQYEDYATYIDCLKTNTVLGSYTGTVCDLPKSVNFALWFIASFNVAAGGFFVFLIFGTSRGVIMAWANLLVCVATGGRKRSATSSGGGSTDSSNKRPSGLRKIVGMPVNSTESGLSTTYTTEMTFSTDQGEEEERDEEGVVDSEGDQIDSTSSSSDLPVRESERSSGGSSESSAVDYSDSEDDGQGMVMANLARH